MSLWGSYWGNWAERMVIEEMENRQVLEMLRNFTPLQQRLLSHPGTLQGVLSAHFCREIQVRVIRQRDSHGVIQRGVQLHDGSNVVCQVDSILNIAREDVAPKSWSKSGASAKYWKP